MSKFFLIFILLITAVGVHAQTPDEIAIQETINALFNGMRTGDSVLLKSAFSETAILQSIATNKEGKVVVRNEPVSAFITAVSKPHKDIYDERIKFESIKVDDNLASVWTPYEFYIGTTFSHCGVDSYQLVKIDGKWKIQYLIDTRRKDKCK